MQSDTVGFDVKLAHSFMLAFIRQYSDVWTFYNGICRIQHVSSASSFSIFLLSSATAGHPFLHAWR